MSLFDMSGQVAVITGSSRDIGKAIAEEMAEQGAKVVISSRKLDACEEVAAAINAKHGEGTAVAIAANISSKDSLQALVDGLRHFGKDGNPRSKAARTLLYNVSTLLPRSGIEIEA